MDMTRNPVKTMLSMTDWDIIGIPTNMRNFRLSNFDVIKFPKLKCALEMAHQTAKDRSNVLITSCESHEDKQRIGKSHLGVGILLTVMKLYHHDTYGSIVPERFRFMSALSYIRGYNTAGYERRAFMDNYIHSFSDGSGIVQCILIDALGDEDDTGIQLMKEVVLTAHDNKTQMIVTSWLSSADILERYGSSAADRILDTKNVIKLIAS